MAKMDQADLPQQLGSTSLEKNENLAETTAQPRITQEGLNAELGTVKPCDVVLRIEFMTQRALKVGLWTAYIVTFTGLAVLLTLFVLKITESDVYFWENFHPLLGLNVAVASLDVLLVGLTLVVYVSKLVHTKRSGRVWSARRKHVASLTCLDLAVQLVNSVCYLAGSGFMRLYPCSLGNAFLQTMLTVRWYCWGAVWVIGICFAHMLMPLDAVPDQNRWWLYRMYCKAFNWTLIRPKGWRRHDDEAPSSLPPGNQPALGGRTAMDLPVWCHAPKLLLWVPVFVFLTVGLVLTLIVVPPGGTFTGTYDPLAPFCRPTYTCKRPTSISLPVSFTVGWFLFLCVLYLLTITRVFVELAVRPYNEYRETYVAASLQARSRGVVYMFSALSVGLLWFVRNQTCNTIALSLPGFLCMQWVTSWSICIAAWANMPIQPRAGLVAEDQLRRVVWAEADMPKVMGRMQDKATSSQGRGAAASTGVGAATVAVWDAFEGALEGTHQQDVSLYCWEMMLRMFYWSYTVYRHMEEAKTGPYTLETAMRMSGCSEYEVKWDKSTDTKSLLAYDRVRRKIIVAFRGTASTQNVLTDVKAWLSPYPPRQGHWWLSTMPCVHAGFLAAWTTGGYGDSIVQHISDIITGGTGDAVDETWRVEVTGHSLGGALATLAAHDIAEACNRLCHLDLVCYTFGCPRVGNRAFAHEVNRMVPNCWHTVYDQDTVPRSGKLFGLYKQSHSKCILRPSGDVLARPSFMEINAFKGAMGQLGFGSPSQHLMGSYRAVMAAIMSKQFETAGLPGARSTLLRMLRDDDARPEMRALLVDVFEANPDPSAGSNPFAAPPPLPRFHKASKLRSAVADTCGGCCGGAAGGRDGVREIQHREKGAAALDGDGKAGGGAEPGEHADEDTAEASSVGVVAAIEASAGTAEAV